MSNTADRPPAAKESLLGEVEDFGQSALHTALESPVNGVIQIIDHAANAHLPELNIIGAPKNDSLGAKAGAVVGAAADIVAVSFATGGVADILGGAGVAGGVVTAAATGAIYGGILTPTDPNSKNFVTDRLTNGTIGAATFAAMGGAAQALGATGLFAAPAARSLAGSLTFGGLAGAAGGVANAEATAVLKEGKPLPSGSELASSVATQALFGAAYAGMGYALNQVAGSASRPTVVKSDVAKITTINDAQGQPVAFRAVVPALDDADDPGMNDDLNVVYNSVKSTTGDWKTTAAAVYKSGGYYGPAEVPDFVSANIGEGGKVSVADADGTVRTFIPDGKYDNSYAGIQIDKATLGANGNVSFSNTSSNGSREVVTPGESYRKYDPQGNTTAIADSSRSSNNAYMSSGPDGNLNTVSLGSATSPSVSLERTAGDTWKTTIGDSIYSWQGDVQQIKDPTSNEVTGMTFTPKEGAPVNFDLQTGTKDVASTLASTGTFDSLKPDTGSAQVGDNGQLVLTSGDNRLVMVNNKLTSGPVAVKPGDNVVVQVDVSDRFPEYEDHPITITRAADGKMAFNGEVIGNQPVSLNDLVKPKAQ